MLLWEVEARELLDAWESDNLKGVAVSNKRDPVSLQTCGRSLDLSCPDLYKHMHTCWHTPNRTHPMTQIEKGEH